MRQSIQFLRSGKVVELTNASPTMTLLDYLRSIEKSKGVKEGCCEGDCGACTVAVGRIVDEQLTYEPVNACIFLIGMLDGRELVTVEDLAVDGTLHQVQKSMVEQHGSQCGFCTPGFVMSLFTLFHAKHENFDRGIVNDWLSGNLCRCTGYRSIIDAAASSCFSGLKDHFDQRSRTTVEILEKLEQNPDLETGNEECFFSAPTTVDALMGISLRHPDATIVNGATDVGIWITKQFKRLQKIIWLGKIQEFRQQKFVNDGLLIGSTATYVETEEIVSKFEPELGRLWRRIGSRQVRSAGTIGGNIVNGSPIGDTIPALIALGAEIELQFGDEIRLMPLEKFYVDYGKVNMRPGEILSCIIIPEKEQDTHFRCYKVSKRFDQDISGVIGAFCLSLDQSRINRVRVAFGGMAATPKRAKLTELALTGANLNDPVTWAPAVNSLSDDFEPISDLRAGAGYRLETARALLVKSLMETSGTLESKTRLSWSGDNMNSMRPMEE